MGCKIIIQILSDIENWLNFVLDMIGFLIFLMEKLLFHEITIVQGWIFLLEW